MKIDSKEFVLWRIELLIQQLHALTIDPHTGADKMGAAKVEGVVCFDLHIWVDVLESALLHLKEQASERK